MTRRFTREEALLEISRLLKILTEAHPDPFMKSGSQVKFYIRVNDITSNLPETLDITQMHIVTSKVTALIGDGHTFMDQLDCPGGRILSVEFKYQNDRYQNPTCGIMVLLTYEVQSTQRLEDSVFCCWKRSGNNCDIAGVVSSQRV